jgi:hypothetical protein
MSRRKTQVQYSLDSGDIKKLSGEEIRAILRGADELIATGGRNMLVKILKGSKDKKVLGYKLQDCPAYGFYHELTMEEISYRVDWMIQKDYLRIDYNGRLPMLIFSEKGWEIERETFAEELFQRFCQDVEKKNAIVIFEMKDVNRQVVFDVLEKIRNTGNMDFIPLLEVWKAMEVHKVSRQIGGVIKALKNG